MPSDALHVYHDLLTDAVAADSQAQLDQQTRQHGLFFGDRPVCSVLRPRFLTPHQFRFLQERVQALLPAFARIYKIGLSDVTFREQLGLTDAEEALLPIDPGFRDPSPTARLDSFYVSDEELKFTEYNTETPAGTAYHDVLSEIFLGLRIVQAFQRRYQVRPLPARPAVLDALLGSFRQWAGNRSVRPQLAIFDWAGVPTHSEFLLYVDYFRSRGLECQIFTPQEAEYRDGKLFVRDYEINLIYKRVLIGELLEQGGPDHPIIRAVRDGAVCMVNSFRCKLLFKKASFAVLSDERNDHLFTATERRAIADHVPWTRRVEERHTLYRGEKIDLVRYVLDHRERFVLKPNDAYGGKGIVLGWTVPAAEWEQAVVAALAEPCVVQERVSLPFEPFPGLIDNKLHVIDRMLDTNPFIGFGGTMDGCLTRISTAELLNVTAGGGSTVPTFVIEER